SCANICSIRFSNGARWYTFVKTVCPRVISVLTFANNGFHRMFGAVVRKEHGPVIHHRFHMHRATPNLPQVGHNITGVIDTQFHPYVLMTQVKVLTVPELAVFHVNQWPSVVRKLEQQPFLDVRNLAAFDFVMAFTTIESESE